MNDSEKLAIAAHLHVLLRRITGRVTDTEWMVRNSEYGRAMIALARQAAATESRPELADCAARLEAALGPASVTPVADSGWQVSGFGEPTRSPSRAETSRIPPLAGTARPGLRR